MRAAYVEQVKALVEAGVDAVLFETLRIMQEAEIAIEAAREHTGLPVMASMVFDRTSERLRNHHGRVPCCVHGEIAASGRRRGGSQLRQRG